MKNPLKNEKFPLHWCIIFAVIGLFLYLPWALGSDKWFMGLGVVSVFLGSIFTRLVQKGLRKYVELYGISLDEFKITEFQRTRHKLQPILTGISERAFFTALIAFDIQGVAAGMFLWITVKMISGWNRYTPDSFPARVRSFNALIMNILSLSFAVIGGIIIRGRIP